MKRTFLLILLFICMAAPSGFAVQPADDVDTIALWHMDTWRFWGLIDLAWDDISAGYRPYNLLVLNTNPPGVTDPCHPIIFVHDVTDGNALSFNGHQQAWGQAKNTYTSGFGVDLEFQAQSVTGTQTIIEATGAWSVSLNGSNVVLTIYTSGATRTLTVTGGAILNTWQHVVASCDAAGNASLQVDSGTPVTGSGLAVIALNADIYLGNTKGSSTKWFTGYIDEVKVKSPGWEASRALSDATGVWGLWHMDSITDSNVLDDDSIVTNRNNDIRLGDIDLGYAAASKPTLVAGGGAGGSALHFDGIQQEAICKTLWPANYNKFNVDLWFKNEAAATDGNSRVIVQAGSVWNIALANGSIGTTIWTAGNPRTLKGLTVSSNAWHHLVMDVTETGRVTRTVDGGTPDVNDGLPVLQSSVGVTFGNKQGAFTRWFKGSIDEVKIIGSNVYIPAAPTAPAKDGPTTKALWHFDSYTADGLSIPDDDVNHPTRNADIPLYADGSSASKWSSPNQGGLWIADPTVAGSGDYTDPAIGYPSGNSAFGKCMYFDGYGGHMILPSSKLSWDPNNVQVEFWMRFPNEWTGVRSANTYYTNFCRGGCMLFRMLYWDLGGQDELHVECLVWDRAGGSKTVSFIFYKLGTTYLDVKQWNHLRVSVVGKVVTLYVNGISKSTQTLANYPATTSPANGNFIGLWDNGNPGITPFWGYMDDFKISKVNATCGDLGYNAADLNQDCLVDYKDVVKVATDWLVANPYLGNSGSSNYPTMIEQKWALGQNMNVPRATVTPTFDGVFNASEWSDARRMEMVWPTLTTAPNTGYTYVAGTTVAAASQADFSQFWFVKWDNTYLYAALVCDDNDVNVGDPLKDAPQIGFNYNADPTHLYLTQAYLWDMQTGNTWQTNSGSVPTPPNSSFVRVNNPAGLAGFVIEAKLAWSDICYGNSSYVPTIGDKHGFVLCSQDHDLSGRPNVQGRTHWYLNVSYANLGLPANWPTITLVNTIDCHEKLQSAYDLDNNCNVNFTDFAKVAASWLNCTDPAGVKCKM